MMKEGTWWNKIGVNKYNAYKKNKEKKEKEKEKGKGEEDSEEEGDGGLEGKKEKRGLEFSHFLLLYTNHKT